MTELIDDVERSSGEVIWFNVQLGYGFIRDDKIEDDVFCHYTKIEAPLGEFRALGSGDKVEYERFVEKRGSKNKIQAKKIIMTEKNRQ